MQTKEKSPAKLLCNFSIIFYVTKLFGIYPHDFNDFVVRKQLKRSTLGSCIVLLNMCFTICGFIWMVTLFENNTFTSDKDNLALVIGFVLTFIGVFAMAIDCINTVRNQTALGQIFEQINVVDMDLKSYNIQTKDVHIKRLLFALMTFSICFEAYGVISTFFIINVDFEWQDLCWIFSGLPTLYSSLDKIWFLGLMLALRERFEAINLALEGIVDRHEQLVNQAQAKRKQKDKSLPTYDKINEQLKMPSSVNKVFPLTNRADLYFGEIVDTPHITMSANMENIETELTDVSGITEKFVHFCQLHDTICLITKSLNAMWSFSLLILMGFGFIIITGYMYFLYCASQQQAIPSLFNSAQSFMVTSLYLLYITSRCVIPMFVSWKTSLAARRTGVCLHKCAVAADTNEIYEIVNHLSLRLINHSVEISAFGYFTLDMTTLYGFIGGITSYLIILIQFNMAGNQVKVAHSMQNTGQFANITKSMPLMYENVTALSDFLLNWYQVPI